MTTTTAAHPLDAFERTDRPEGADYLGKPKRTLVTEWEVASGTDKHGNPCSTLAQVTTHHWAGRKQFASSFSWVARHLVPRHEADGPGGPVAIDRWASDNMSVRVLAEPVARYSKKGLVSAHGQAVATVLEHYSGTNLETVVEQAGAYAMEEEF